LGQQINFSELEDGNLDNRAFDASMLGDDDVKLGKSSAKYPASGSVKEIKHKFHKCTQDAHKNFC